MKDSAGRKHKRNIKPEQVFCFIFIISVELLNTKNLELPIEGVFPYALYQNKQNTSHQCVLLFYA